MNSLQRGDFRLNGSWNPSASAQHRGPLYAFIAGLVRARLAAGISPSALAAQIEGSKWASAFGELTQWKTLGGWLDWPYAWTRTSADETVKRCGIGAVKEFHWEGATCISGEDERPFVPATGEQVRDGVEAIAKLRLGATGA